MTLTHKILIAMAAGVLVGLPFSLFPDALASAKPVFVDGVLLVVGRLFFALLQVIVVPLVLVSIVAGVTALGDLRSLGRIGAKTLALYLLTTGAAAALALIVGNVVDPGVGFEAGRVATYEAREPPSLTQVLIDLVPTNPVRALAEGQMLQIIVFALLLGVAVSAAGEAGKRVARAFDDFNEVMLRLVGIVIRAAPLGVFALIGRTFADQGLDAFAPLAAYFAAVVVALAAHAGLVYSGLLRLAGLRVRTFLAKTRAVMVFAFSTSSSNATIPVTLSTMEKRLGVPNEVAAFCAPVGATVNMDGTAIMQGVATVFVANVYGVPLGFGDYIAVILTATLASIGTAGVPGVGLVMLAMVLGQVGLPVEGIGLIIGVDRLLDMLRTAVNVLGDCVVACLVARSERTLDLAMFAASAPIEVADGIASEPARDPR
ncbi:MAG TPA: dicarboxylate/amino acid:cation symporter [Gammaproteobacteria bacterium]